MKKIITIFIVCICIAGISYAQTETTDTAKIINLKEVVITARNNFV